MHRYTHKFVAALLLVVIGIVGYVPRVKAEQSFRVGNATVTADCVSHTTAWKTAGKDLDCKDLNVGVEGHKCCWGYTAAVYRKIWGESFSYSNSDKQNNLLRNLEASERKCTAENLERFFAQTQPGAVLRIDTKSNPTDKDGSSGHTMLFLELGSDGGVFYEGNYDSKGNTRIVYHTWKTIEEKYGKYNGKDRYIKYIYWKGAPTFTQDFTIVDNITRIAVSTKAKTGNAADDQCYIKDTPFEDGKTVEAIDKGSTINIVGKVKNKYENIWYKTEDGNFVYSGDVTVYEVDWDQMFTLSANFTYNRSAKTHLLPYADSPDAGNVNRGQAFAVKGFVANKYGNIWAQLSDGSFICFHDMDKNETYMTFHSHVTQPTHSTTYPKDNITVSSSQGFWLKGPVKAQVPFLYVSTRIVNRETGKDVTEAGSPVKIYPATNVRSFDIYETKVNGNSLDSQTLFRKLPAGWYRYELNVQFGFKYEDRTFMFGDEMNLVKSNFSANKAGETFEEDATDTFTEYSTLFNIHAAFTNLESCSSRIAPYAVSEKVKSIEAGATVIVVKFVENSYGNIWAMLEDGSYLCFYDAQSGEIKLDFFKVAQNTEVSGVPESDSVPGLPHGQREPGTSCGLRGKITTYAPMLSVTARVRNANGEVINTPATVKAEPNYDVRTVQINKSIENRDGSTTNINNEMAFAELKDAGDYRYEVAVQLGFVFAGKTFYFGNEQVVISSEFIISAAEELLPDVSNPDAGDVVDKPEDERVPGDANEDGRVNARDSLAILKYVSGWDITISTSNANVNGDGKVNARDSLAILKYVSGWDIVLQ